MRSHAMRGPQARVAERYLHEEPPHLTYDQIISDACAAPTKAGRKLNKKAPALQKRSV